MLIYAMVERDLHTRCSIESIRFAKAWKIVYNKSNHTEEEYSQAVKTIQQGADVLQVLFDLADTELEYHDPELYDEIFMGTYHMYGPIPSPNEIDPTQN